MKHTCLICWKPSGRCRFCRECDNHKRRAWALVSQNATKIKKLLKSEWFNTLWFEKFILYANNIIENGRELIKYKTANELRSLIVIQNFKLKK